MSELADRDTPQTLVDAQRIAERALRLSGVNPGDPFETVHQAAQYLQLSGSRALERVVEEMTDAGTVTLDPAGIQKFLREVIAHIRLCRGQG